MNATDTVKVIAVIKALCPNQRFEEATHRAWAMVMSDIRPAEAQSAVQTIYREQGSDAQWVRTIEADDIIRQVKRDRSGRDRVKCYICGNERSACDRLHNFEVEHRLPDPHDFESFDQATRSSVARQMA